MTLRSLSDTEVRSEVKRRKLSVDDRINDWGDPLPYGLCEYDLSVISDADLRNAPLALREVEKLLSGYDGRFVGFADDVARHYGRPQ